MRNVLLALASAALLGHRDVGAQAKPASIRGVWQAVQVTTGGPSPRTITIAEPRPNLTIITARHYSQLRVGSESPRPALADAATATADELRAVWGPFSGDAGTYELVNDRITMHPVVAKNPAAMAPGAFATYAIKLQGDTLSVTEQRTHRGPVTSPATIRLVRVE